MELKKLLVSFAFAAALSTTAQPDSTDPAPPINTDSAPPDSAAEARPDSTDPAPPVDTDSVPSDSAAEARSDSTDPAQTDPTTSARTTAIDQEQQASTGPTQPSAWTVNGSAIPLTKFIAQVAEITGKTIVVDPRVKSTQEVTVLSSVSLDADGLYELFLTVLRVHGLGASETDGVVSVVQQVLVKQSAGPVAGAEDQPPDQLLTQVVPLTHVPSLEVVKILRPLIPQTGHIASIETPNVIVVADYASNMPRLLALIGEIDIVDKDEIVHRTLEYAWVGTVASVLEKVAPEQLGSGAKGPKRVLIVANERNNSLILKGKAYPVAEALRLVDKLDVPQTSIGAAQVFHLNHADAVTVAGILDKLINQSGSAGAPVANIQADESLNALIVRADPTTMNELLATVSQLDVRRAQVLIEAAIVEISVDSVKSLGVELGAADARGSSTPLVATPFTINSLVGGLLNRLNEDGVATDPLAAVAGGTSPTIAIAKLDPDGISFAAVINALLTDTRANLLSTPSVLTLDNEEAIKTAGQQVPFRTGSFTTATDGASNPFQTINRENVGVELKVTPHIHDDSSIRMVISLKVGNVVDAAGLGEGGFADVVTNERSLQSTVLAEDRQIILLGGLIQDDIRDVSRRVPLLSSIPILGRAFRSDTKTLIKRHLLMFLRPTILLSGNEAERTALDRYQGIYQLRGDDNFPPEKLEGIFENRAGG